MHCSLLSRGRAHTWLHNVPAFAPRLTYRRIWDYKRTSYYTARLYGLLHASSLATVCIALNVFVRITLPGFFLRPCSAGRCTPRAIG